MGLIWIARSSLCTRRKLDDSIIGKGASQRIIAEGRRAVMRTTSKSVVFTIICAFSLLAGSIGPVSQQLSAQDAVPFEVGLFPESLREACDTLNTGLSIASLPLGLIASLAAFIGGNELDRVCREIPVERTEGYRNAYREAANNGMSPGFPVDRVHYGQDDYGVDFQIQHFAAGSQGDGTGAIIWGSGRSKPFYVGGGTWAAYKRAIDQKSVLGGSIYPGYPTSVEQTWAGVRIQFFEGGSWGNGAIIGGDDAWFVTGRHWDAYWNADGWHSLGKPLGPVYRNSNGHYQQDFTKGNITELSGNTSITYNNSAQAAAQQTMPAELPPSGNTQPSQPQSAACDDSGRPVLTSNLSASPSNPDTKTPVSFSFTIRNDGCGTFAPQKMMIAGRDPANNVTDPTQRDGFRLAPGQSYTFEHTTTLKDPGMHKFWVAYMDWTNNWPKVPNTNGQVLEVHINVSAAPPEPTQVTVTEPQVETQPPSEPEVESADASQEAEPVNTAPQPDPDETAPPAVESVESQQPGSADLACNEGKLPVFRDGSDGLHVAGSGVGTVRIEIEIVNPSCSLYEADYLEVYSDSPNGKRIELMIIDSFVLEPGEEWVIQDDFVLTDPGQHRIRIGTFQDGMMTNLLLERHGDDFVDQAESDDYFSVHVSDTLSAPSAPSAPGNHQPVDIEPDGSDPVNTSSNNPSPSAPNPTEVVGCDMIWDGQKWVVESC